MGGSAGRPPAGTVYVTGLGRTCPGCGQALAACDCAARAARAAAQRAEQSAADGTWRVVKLRRDRAQRGGKVVTLIEGLALAAPALDLLLAERKRKCSSGGTRRDGVLELQGDQREKLEAELGRRGYVVRRADG